MWFLINSEHIPGCLQGLRRCSLVFTRKLCEGGNSAGMEVRGPELESVVFKMRLGEVSGCRSTQPQGHCEPIGDNRS